MPQVIIRRPLYELNHRDQLGFTHTFGGSALHDLPSVNRKLVNQGVVSSRIPLAEPNSFATSGLRLSASQGNFVAAKAGKYN
jgi:hypothetical protein